MRVVDNIVSKVPVATIAGKNNNKLSTPFFFTAKNKEDRAAYVITKTRHQQAIFSDIGKKNKN